MLAKTLLAATLASLAAADFAIVTTTEIYSASTSFKNLEDASKWAADKSSKLESAASTFLTHLTAQPEYTSYYNALSSFVATRTDAPDVEVILATTTTTSYTKEPAWYTALPNDIKEYVSKNQESLQDIASSVVYGGAPAAQVTGMAYMGAVGAAVVGAVAML
ncbi:hypothetical protein EJ04DRAFT_507776 [Polyplosphaeria fusca]|uniref:Uncharacterized protein n=1 Tax=Polyplosphaeria fusca TaxID=682080 RepID=A0A9P4V9P2_9PLEO|nr:hypothetical protein EJ04DRAFT_507776 [Polyplosphaeria fusca]